MDLWSMPSGRHEGLSRMDVCRSAKRSLSVLQLAVTSCRCRRCCWFFRVVDVWDVWYVCWLLLVVVVVGCCLSFHPKEGPGLASREARSPARSGRKDLWGLARAPPAQGGLLAQSGGLQNGFDQELGRVRGGINQRNLAGKNGKGWKRFLFWFLLGLWCMILIHCFRWLTCWCLVEDHAKHLRFFRSLIRTNPRNWWRSFKRLCSHLQGKVKNKSMSGIAAAMPAVAWCDWWLLYFLPLQKTYINIAAPAFSVALMNASVLTPLVE